MSSFFWWAIFVVFLAFLAVAIAALVFIGIHSSGGGGRHRQHRDVYGNVIGSRPNPPTNNVSFPALGNTSAESMPPHNPHSLFNGANGTTGEQGVERLQEHHTNPSYNANAPRPQPTRPPRHCGAGAGATATQKKPSFWSRLFGRREKWRRPPSQPSPLVVPGTGESSVPVLVEPCIPILAEPSIPLLAIPTSAKATELSTEEQKRSTFLDLNGDHKHGSESLSERGRLISCVTIISKGPDEEGWILEKVNERFPRLSQYVFDPTDLQTRSKELVSLKDLTDDEVCTLITKEPLWFVRDPVMDSPTNEQETTRDEPIDNKKAVLLVNTLVQAQEIKPMVDAFILPGMSAHGQVRLSHQLRILEKILSKTEHDNEEEKHGKPWRLIQMSSLPTNFGSVEARQLYEQCLLRSVEGLRERSLFVISAPIDGKPPTRALIKLRGEPNVVFVGGFDATSDRLIGPYDAEVVVSLIHCLSPATTLPELTHAEATKQCLIRAASATSRVTALALEGFSTPAETKKSLLQQTNEQSLIWEEEATNEAQGREKRIVQKACLAAT